MTTIKDIFAKNGNTRNKFFCVFFSFFVMIVATWLFMGHRFVYTAPIVILLMLMGLYFKPPKYYLPFCAGILLQFGLFASLIHYLMMGFVSSVLVELLIGCVGYLLLITSIWQAVIGEWAIPAGEKLTRRVAIVGIIFSIMVVAVIEYQGAAPVESAPVHETY